MPYTLLLEKHVRSGLVRLRQLRIGLQIGGCIFNRLRHRRLALTDKRIDSRVGELSCPQIALLPYRVCDSHAEPGKGIVVVIGSVAPPRLPRSLPHFPCLLLTPGSIPTFHSTQSHPMPPDRTSGT